MSLIHSNFIPSNWKVNLKLELEKSCNAKGENEDIKKWSIDISNMEIVNNEWTYDKTKCRTR